MREQLLDLVGTNKLSSQPVHLPPEKILYGGQTVGFTGKDSKES